MSTPTYPGCELSLGDHLIRFSITVGNLDSQIEFFTRVLDFKLTAIKTFNTPDLAKLYAVPGLHIKMALLEIGAQKVSLIEYLEAPGCSYNPASRSNDMWFQHLAIVVRDMEQAVARLKAADVKFISQEPITIPDSNQAAAGIKAVYFRTPEGHPLELIYFPPGKGLPVWHEPADRLFLGIDHTALAVSDTERSLHFYGELLGLKKMGESLNTGITQEKLTSVPGAKVRITGLRHEQPGSVGIEFLQYLEPCDGRPIPDTRGNNDLAYGHPVIFCRHLPALADKLKAEGVRFVSPGVVQLDSADAFGHACMIRDPDGHDLLLLGP